MAERLLDYRNIIYSNEITNRYGKFRCFCTPINHYGD